MKGRPPKHPERRQGHRPRHALALRVAAKVPPAPEGLLKMWSERWTVYWRSELATATREAHIPVVERLFYRYDERERAFRAVRKFGRVVKGSQDQPVANPLLKYIDTCDAEIRQLEDRLGLSPYSMAKLGTNFANAQKSLDDLNRTMAPEEDDDRDDVDPRVQIVQ